MHIQLQQRISQAINKEIITKSLTEYFKSKGYNPTTILVYPPQIKDIATSVPAVSDKIELIPSPNSIDPTSGIAKLRWDLFVLGTNRICLGETTHASLSELNGIIHPHSNRSKLNHSAQDIIDFIVQILGKTDGGFDIPPPPSMNQPFIATNRPPRGGITGGGDMYERPRFT